jgi:hypothetical protein
MKRQIVVGEKLICVGNNLPKGPTISSKILGSIHVVDKLLASPAIIMTRGPNTLYSETTPVCWGIEDFISYPDEIDRSKK